MLIRLRLLLHRVYRARWTPIAHVLTVFFVSVTCAGHAPFAWADEKPGKPAPSEPKSPPGVARPPALKTESEEKSPLPVKPAAPKPATAKAAGVAQDKPEPKDAPKLQRAKAALNANAGARPLGPLSLPTDLISTAADRTRGIREQEREAYYQVLARAREVDLAVQKSAGRKTVAEARQKFAADKKNARKKYSLFVDIITDPDRFRGQPLSLTGYIHKIDEMAAGENEQGLQTLYQVWLYTADSYSSPYVVVCSEIPANIPMPKRGNPTSDVFVTGYFFKLYSYEAERGNWGAPLILAGRLEWNPPPPPARLSTNQKIAIGLGLVVLVVVLVFFMRKSARGDKQFRETQLAKFADPEPENLKALRELEHD